MAVVGRPPVLRRLHHLEYVVLQRVDVEGRELFGVGEVLVHRIGPGRVLMENLKVQLIRPPVPVRPGPSRRGGRGGDYRVLAFAAGHVRPSSCLGVSFGWLLALDVGLFRGVEHCDPRSQRAMAPAGWEPLTGPAAVDAGHRPTRTHLMHDADDRSWVGVRMVAHRGPHRYENTLSTPRNKHSKPKEGAVALRRVRHRLHRARLPACRALPRRRAMRRAPEERPAPMGSRNPGKVTGGPVLPGPRPPRRRHSRIRPCTAPPATGSAPSGRSAMRSHDTSAGCSPIWVAAPSARGDGGAAT